MTKEQKNKIKIKCEQCKKTFMVWADGLDPDVEKTEDMKNHKSNYCPVCELIKK